nr:MAG TPA: hypothetical protein [Caudoviricetes sp.]
MLPGFLPASCGKIQFRNQSRLHSAPAATASSFH